MVGISTSGGGAGEGPAAAPAWRLGRRRLLLGGVALGVAGIGGHRAYSHLAAGGQAQDMALVQTLCDLTIPASDTPGAVGVGAPAFVLSATAHGMRGAPPETLSQLRDALDSAAGAQFLGLPKDRQIAVLSQVDQATVAARPPSPWGLVKTFILRGYYTSEIGATQELQFDPVPGRYDGAVPVTASTRAFSSDANIRNALSS